jgi:hypothetical protein
MREVPIRRRAVRGGDRIEEVILAWPAAGFSQPH